MSHLHFALVVAILSAFDRSSVAHGQEHAPSGSACVFPGSDVTAPVVVGPDDIVRRVVVVQPRDAPIRILRVDFTGATLTMGDRFRFAHNYWIEVVNVTDQAASGSSPMVWAFSGNAVGAHHAGGHAPLD